jgi:hypothetical protein
MQNDTLLILSLCGFAAIFAAIGVFGAYHGWRFLSFQLIGGFVARLIGGRPEDEANDIVPVVTPQHLDPEAAKSELEFHAEVARYRNQQKATGESPVVAADEVSTSPEVPIDPGSVNDKSAYGVRYSSDNPGRVLRDKRYERVKGPDSGHDSEVYVGMFKQKPKNEKV